MWFERAGRPRPGLKYRITLAVIQAPEVATIDGERLSDFIRDMKGPLPIGRTAYWKPWRWRATAIKRSSLYQISEMLGWSRVLTEDFLGRPPRPSG